MTNDNQAICAQVNSTGLRKSARSLRRPTIAGIRSGAGAVILTAACIVLMPGSAYAQDHDCSDFSSQAAAQAFYLASGGPGSDPHRLDSDNDGVACEALPCPCETLAPAPPPTGEPPLPAPPPPSDPPPRSGPRRTIESAIEADVTAELSYTKRRRWRDGFRQTVHDDLRVRILHGEQVVYDQPVPSPCKTRCSPATWTDPGPAIRVIDLDGDGRPEAIAELITERPKDFVGCCHIAVAYGFDPAIGSYQPTVLDTGEDHRPRFTPSGVVIQGADARWLNFLSCAECGYRPTRIWKYTSPVFVDVTREHPGLIRQDVRRLRRHYRTMQRGSLAIYRKGALTPLVGNLCLLDRCQEGLRLVRRAIRAGELIRSGPHDRTAYGTAYLNSLRRHLRRTGYTLN
jgi:hypothetical protein